VGKSVALLETALALCGRDDIDARRVIHIPCDQMTARDLRRVLTVAVELTRSVDRDGRIPRAWLFDEVTQISGWTATIKAARDGTDFGAPVTGSQSKYYLIDPLVAWLPVYLRAGAAPPDMTRLTEMVLGVCQARAIEANQEGRWIEGNTIGFAKTDAGNEVDLSPVPFATLSGTALTVPLESKWVDSNWRSEGQVLNGKYHRGVLATKSILDLTDDVWAVPAPMIALLMV
jgi:hypothetical protein